MAADQGGGTRFNFTKYKIKENWINIMERLEKREIRMLLASDQWFFKLAREISSINFEEVFGAKSIYNQLYPNHPLRSGIFLDTFQLRNERDEHLNVGLGASNLEFPIEVNNIKKGYWMVAAYDGHTSDDVIDNEHMGHFTVFILRHVEDDEDTGTILTHEEVECDQQYRLMALKESNLSHEDISDLLWASGPLAHSMVEYILRERFVALRLVLPDDLTGDIRTALFQWKLNHEQKVVAVSVQHIIFDTTRVFLGDNFLL